MAFLGKYGVARHIYVPVIKRAVVDFAVSADWTPAAGDVKISKDGGAAANVTNLPTAITMGNTAMWDFSLTATEMQAAQVMVTVADAVTKAVEDTMFIVETYGDAAAQHALDLDTTPVAANVTQWLGSAAATPTVAGVPEVDVTHFNGVAGTFAAGRPETIVNSINANAITAAAIATGAIDADALATDAVTEIRSLVSGTADSGSTTTMVDAARTEADVDYWKGDIILFTSGTISGQARLITAFDPATDTITFAPAVTQAVLTNTYEILPSGAVNVQQWKAATVPTPGTSGVPQVDVLIMQPDTITATTIANAAIDAAAFAAGAINAAAIATDAFDADALAADALAEIKTQVVNALNVDTYAEPGQETPAATSTLVTKIGYLFKAFRNRHTQTAGQFSLYNDDATTIAQKATVSDDGTTFDRGELATGP